MRDLRGRLTRWIYCLILLDFKVYYYLRKTNTVDSLFRRLDFIKGELLYNDILFTLLFKLNSSNQLLIIAY